MTADDSLFESTETDDFRKEVCSKCQDCESTDEQCDYCIQNWE